MNRKIKNATPTEYNGVKFRSKLEASCAKVLDEHGVKYEYEPFSLIILPAFKHPHFSGRVTQAVKYTPDFVVNNNILLELKGFPNDSYSLRRKLILKYLVDNQYPYEFYEIHNKTELLNFIKLLNEESV